MLWSDCPPFCFIRGRLAKRPNLSHVLWIHNFLDLLRSSEFGPPRQQAYSKERVNPFQVHRRLHQSDLLNSLLNRIYPHVAVLDCAILARRFESLGLSESGSSRDASFIAGVRLRIKFIPIPSSALPGHYPGCSHIHCHKSSPFMQRQASLRCLSLWRRSFTSSCDCDSSSGTRDWPFGLEIRKGEKVVENHQWSQL